MSIYIPNNVDKEFILTTLKKYYLLYLKTSLFNSKSKKESVELMNNYLVDNYNITLKEIFQAILDNILLTKQGDYYKLTINDSVMIKDYTLSQLMRLVDYGNLEIKGLHIFNKVEKYIQSKLQAIFVVHTMNKIKKEN